MITDNEGGISCGNCDHEEIVTTRAASNKLAANLEWTTDGNPVCPECGWSVMFEDYIDD